MGIPLFEEQLLRMAMVAAGFTGGEAEELRRALGFKRSKARMKKVELKLRQSLKHTGITGRGSNPVTASRIVPWGTNAATLMETPGVKTFSKYSVKKSR